MKSLSHGRKVEPIEPDDTIVPDMRFTDRVTAERVEMTGTYVREESLAFWDLVVAQQQERRPA